jgi:hypothetical protein
MLLASHGHVHQVPLQTPPHNRPAVAGFADALQEAKEAFV